MKKSNLVVTLLLFVLAALCFVFFEVLKTPILKDVVSDKYFRGFITRLSLSMLFGWLLYLSGGRRLMIINKKKLKLVLWSLPCFMVAFVNFPYSALISGKATIEHVNALGFYALYIVGVAFVEEFIFRGVIVVVLKDYLRNNRHAPLFIVLISSLIFSLFHLTNLIGGQADIGSVLLQCVYTLLIGAMLAVTILRTQNIWLCILIHAIFDFGGLLDLSSSPWDTTFWILTIISGVLCAGHIIYTLIKLEKDYVSA